MKTIRILIADDHHLVADSLSLLLGSVAEFEIVGTVNNGWQALEFVERNEVDVVLTDYHMPLLNGAELTIKLKEKGVKVKAVMLTMNEDAACIKESIQAGVYGYVMKSAEKPELIKAIKAVIGGEKYFSEKIIRKLAEIPSISSLNGKTHVNDLQSLTKREVEIVRLIADDLSNVDISQRLNISLSTGETHRRNIMKKLGVSTAIGLVKWGIKNGILSEMI